MLRDFLETNIQNKLNIFFMLSAHESVSVREVSETLNISPSNVLFLLDELKSDLSENAVIKKVNTKYSIDSNKNELVNSMYAIYRTSRVLECLKFMIANDSQKTFSYFIDESYLTKSTAYRVRETCLSYLDSIGLGVKNNRIVGDEYRIRFLIALLYYEYGIDCLGIDASSIKLARDFVIKTNKAITPEFLSQTVHEYGYFECLLILSWKRRKYPVTLPPSDEFAVLKEIFVYDEMKHVLKETIEPALNVCFSEEDYDYIYLVYCCTNSCVFADRWNQEKITDVHKLIFDQKHFNELLFNFEQKLGKDLVEIPAFRSALVGFFKKCLLGLQCLIPDEHLYLDCKFDDQTLKIAGVVSQIFNEWTNDLIDSRYPLDETHLFYLSIQLKSIMRQMLPPVEIIIVSDIVSELSDMSLFLNRKFSPNLITIMPYLLNAQSPATLLHKENCIIITNKKFKNILCSLGFAEKNKIVPITIGINDNDIRMIGESIMESEQKKFDELVAKH